VYTHQQQQTPGAVQRPGFTPQQSSWQTRAITAYHHSQPHEAALRQQLAAAVHALTGRSIDDAAIVVDLPGRTAFARIDGIHFRWANGELSVVRPCAHCGLGAFVSLPVQGAEELGFALSDWQPLHEDCRPFEADEVA
jgi:hypothetical protein